MLHNDMTFLYSRVILIALAKMKVEKVPTINAVPNIVEVARLGL